MKTFPYTCKFCAKPGTVSADESGLDIFKIEVWLPKMACNRCSKFMENKRRLQSDIFKCCRVLQICRESMNGEKRKGIETSTHEKLIYKTKEFAALACDYYRLMNVWDSEFANIIFDKPESAGIAISVYLQGLAKEAFKEPTESTP